ncbi:TonB-dependent receptor [Sphingomonadaceae bacterium jetA1]|jgi:outer membrane receptor protein involved in Fe transport|uniref:TonB-dependent receptor n=1 Tax=Facivitalis istanbulensis TaxID=3075838 RepID=UPI00348B319E
MKTFAMTLLAATSLSCSAAALAQQTPPPGQADHEGDAAAPAPGTMRPDDTRQDDVVVTGEKFGRTLKDTATSVTIVSAREISGLAAVTSRDLLDTVPNVNRAGADGRFAIRGITFDNITGAGYGALGTIYVDRVRLGDKATRFGPDLLFDVRAVEVLRGAQSTLQGRNALAGAIYITTNDPGFDWETAVRARYASGQDSDLAALIGGPITDRLAFRLTVEKHDLGGFVDDPTLGHKTQFQDDLQLRGKLLWEPAANLKVHLTGSYADVRRYDSPSDTRVPGADGLLPRSPSTALNVEQGIPGVASGDRRVTYMNIPGFDHDKVGLGGVFVDWTVSPALTLTSETSGQVGTNFKQRDGDGGYFTYSPSATSFAVVAPAGFTGYFPRLAGSTAKVDPIQQQYQRFWMVAQEFRAKYDAGGPLRLLGGVYYTHESRRQFDYSQLMFRNVSSTVGGLLRQAGLPAATAGMVARLYPADVPVYSIQTAPIDVDNIAAYAEAEYDVTPRLTLDVGARYDREWNTSASQANGGVIGLPGTAGLPAALAGVVTTVNKALSPFSGTISSIRVPQSFDAVLPKLSLRWKMTDAVTVGATAQRAYRAGGVSLNPSRQLVTTLKPEYTWNYELFTRAALWNGLLTLDANAFYTDWRDLQASINLSNNLADQIGVNAGHARIYGFEASARLRPGAGLGFDAGVGYADTRFLSFDATLPPVVTGLGIPIDVRNLTGLAGKRFAFAPLWSASGTAFWQNDSGFVASVNVNYRASSYSGISSDPAYRNDPRTLVNLSLAQTIDRLTLKLFARNLFDVDYITSNTPAQPLYGEPRSIGIEAGLRF